MIKHFVLKFNYGVEIGAYLAYRGHYEATGDLNIRQIARDEVIHRAQIRAMLFELGEEPNEFINGCFRLIGTTINTMCHYSPRFLLNIVARTMEIFAVYNYKKLSKRYPKFKYTLEHMAKTEEKHQRYFYGVQ